jgi:hypothetical protein
VTLGEPESLFGTDDNSKGAPVHGQASEHGHDTGRQPTYLALS